MEPFTLENCLSNDNGEKEEPIDSAVLQNLRRREGEEKDFLSDASTSDSLRDSVRGGKQVAASVGRRRKRRGR